MRRRTKPHKPIAFISKSVASGISTENRHMTCKQHVPTSLDIQPHTCAFCGFFDDLEEKRHHNCLLPICSKCMNRVLIQQENSGIRDPFCPICLRIFERGEIIQQRQEKEEISNDLACDDIECPICQNIYIPESGSLETRCPICEIVACRCCSAVPFHVGEKCPIENNSSSISGPNEIRKEKASGNDECGRFSKEHCELVKKELNLWSRNHNISIERIMAYMNIGICAKDHKPICLVSAGSDLICPICNCDIIPGCPEHEYSSMIYRCQYCCATATTFEQDRENVIPLCNRCYSMSKLRTVIHTEKCGEMCKFSPHGDSRDEITGLCTICQRKVSLP